MTCDKFQTPGGGVVIVCSRGQRRRKVPVRCLVCKERLGRHLCDYVLDSNSRKPATCDMTMCEHCIVKQSDGAELCPGHARVQASADAWLAELDANEVDRDALHYLFPDWPNIWSRQSYGEQHAIDSLRGLQAVLGADGGLVYYGAIHADPYPDGCPECGDKHAPMEACYGGYDPHEMSETEILGVVGDRH